MEAVYLKKTFSVALPVILTQLTTTITGFIGMAFLATLGHTVLAASALLYSIQTMILVIGASPLFSLSILVSRAFGGSEKHEIGIILKQSWILTLLIVLIIFVLYSSISFILHAFGQLPQLVAIIKPYFNIARWGVPAALMNISCSQFLLGIGKQKLVAMLSVLRTLFLIVTGYIFVLGHFGVMHYGVAGWGVAFTITAWLMLFIILSIFYWQHDFKKFQIFSMDMRGGLRHLNNLFKFGWPIMFQTGSELFSFGFVTLMVGWLGAVALASMQVVTQFLMIMVIPAYGFSMSASVLVGYSLGAKNYTQARIFGYINFILCTLLITFFAIVINVFPTQLAHIFLQPAEPNYQQILALVKTIFTIVAFSQIFDSIRNSLTGALRGLLDMRFPMIVSFIAIWVLRVPISYYLAFKLHMGVIGIAYGAVIGMFVGSIIIFWRWYQKTKNIHLIHIPASKQ
ncbi:MAG: MATE family efflux transporter [Pseudomonadota bacterium]